MYFSKYKMPVGAGAAKMDWPSYYAGRESQAIAEFGRAFGATGELALKRMDAIVQSEFTTAKADWETAHIKFEESLREDPDYENYHKKYDEYSKKIQKDILSKAKSPASKKILSQMFEQLTPSVKKSISNIAWEKKRNAMVSDLLLAVRKHELSGNSGAAEAALIEAVDAGIMPADIAANRVLQIKRNVDWNNGYEMAGSDPEGFLAIVDGGFFPNLDKQDIEQLRSRARTSLATKTAIEKETLEIQREVDRDVISKAIQSGSPDTAETIDRSSLDEAEQWTWNERYRAEMKRRAEGDEIVTDHEVRSRINSGIFQMLTGAKTKNDVLNEAKSARFDPNKPTLSDSDYNKIETAINAQYEQAYTRAMAKVDTTAQGILLNPDSLGYIKNAPVRWKIYADFQQAWMDWISQKGDTLTIKEIYPEGQRMASMFQVSEEEAERLEEEMNEELRKREKEFPTKGGDLLPVLTGRDIPEEYRKLGVEKYRPPGRIAELPAPSPLGTLEKAVGKENAAMEIRAWGVLYDLWEKFSPNVRNKISADYKSGITFTEIIQDNMVESEINRIVGKKPPEIPHPKTKSEYDKLPAGTKDIDPEGVERIKK